jgi:hypothetical protein
MGAAGRISPQFVKLRAVTGNQLSPASLVQVSITSPLPRGAQCVLVLENRVSPNIGSIQKNVIKNLKTFSSTIGNNKAIDVI